MQKLFNSQLLLKKCDGKGLRHTTHWAYVTLTKPCLGEHGCQAKTKYFHLLNHWNFGDEKFFYSSKAPFPIMRGNSLWDAKSSIQKDRNKGDFYDLPAKLWSNNPGSSLASNCRSPNPLSWHTVEVLQHTIQAASLVIPLRNKLLIFFLKKISGSESIMVTSPCTSRL